VAGGGGGAAGKGGGGSGSSKDSGMMVAFWVIRWNKLKHESFFAFVFSLVLHSH
jgi:hypothetical protein